MTLAFPALLLLIAIAAAFGPSLTVLFLVLGLLGWAPVARVLRSQVLSLRSSDYVEAARVAGCSRRRIMLVHILPGCRSTLLVLFSMGMAGAIIAEGSLSFLGLGAQRPEPSWGVIIQDGFDFLRSAPWLTLIPGAAMALAVLGFNLLGDGLRDLLDPRGSEGGAA
jgi:ABC-type dipeptide/oligopeptide/nickel transport system permease subunit